MVGGQYVRKRALPSRPRFCAPRIPRRRVRVRRAAKYGILRHDRSRVLLTALALPPTSLTVSQLHAYALASKLMALRAVPLATGFEDLEKKIE